MPKRDAKFFQILISQMTQDGDVNIVFGKRWAYSDMPSFLSQSAICCMTATNSPVVA